MKIINTFCAIISLIMIITGCGGGGSSGNEGGIKYQLNGLCFSPYTTGDPTKGDKVDLVKINTLLEVIKPYTNWITTYGATNGVEQIAGAAKARGLKVAAGCWLSADKTANHKELDGLEALIKAKKVDLAVVGNEVLLRGDLTEDELIASIREVKALGVSVATRDTWNTLLAHPKVMAECDVILANFFPYWEGVKLDVAVKSIHQHYQQLKNAVGGKEVIVGETGWPSAGNAFKDAVPSPENAAFFFLNVASWAQAENIKCFYFEAFDEPWKEKNEGPQGAHWGLWDVSMKLKPGMQKVFDGQTIPNNWSDNGELPVVIYLPTENQYSQNPITTVSFNVSQSLKRCEIWIDATLKETISPCPTSGYSKEYTLAEGKHNLEIKGVTDAGEQIKAGPRVFNIDFTVPTIKITNPGFKTRVHNPLTIRYSLADNLPGLLRECSILLDGARVRQNESCPQDEYTYQPDNLANGIHWIQIAAIDQGGNQQQSPMHYFAIVPESSKPALIFTHVPPYGDKSTANLVGLALSIAPDDYKVVVYIYVPDWRGWWVKPYDTHPLTKIDWSASWECDITTGGMDDTATKITAFLIPNGYDPPILLGSDELPSELYQKAVTYLTVERSP